MDKQVEELDVATLKREKARLQELIQQIDVRLKQLAASSEPNRFGELYGWLAEYPSLSEEEISAVRKSAHARLDAKIEELLK